MYAKYIHCVDLRILMYIDVLMYVDVSNILYTNIY